MNLIPHSPENQSREPGFFSGDHEELLLLHSSRGKGLSLARGVPTQPFTG